LDIRDRTPIIPSLLHNRPLHRDIHPLHLPSRDLPRRATVHGSVSMMTRFGTPSITNSSSVSLHKNATPYKRTVENQNILSLTKIIEKITTIYDIK
jgi:hypothetical protein